MKQLLAFSFIICLSFAVQAQPGDSKTVYETGRNFMRTGDYENAVIVLTRALQHII